MHSSTKRAPNSLLQPLQPTKSTYTAAKHVSGSRAGSMSWVRGANSTAGALTVALRPSAAPENSTISVHQPVSSPKPISDLTSAPVQSVRSVRATWGRKLACMQLPVQLCELPVRKLVHQRYVGKNPAARGLNPSLNPFPNSRFKLAVLSLISLLFSPSSVNSTDI